MPATPTSKSNSLNTSNEVFHNNLLKLLQQLLDQLIELGQTVKTISKVIDSHDLLSEKTYNHCGQDVHSNNQHDFPLNHSIANITSKECKE